MHSSEARRGTRRRAAGRDVRRTAEGPRRTTAAAGRTANGRRTSGRHRAAGGERGRGWTRRTDSTCRTGSAPRQQRGPDVDGTGQVGGGHALEAATPKGAARKGAGPQWDGRDGVGAAARGRPVTVGGATGRAGLRPVGGARCETAYALLRAGRPRGARRADAGFVTAETALVVPVLVALVAVLIWGLIAACARIECVDAARAGARLAARSEPHGVVLRAARGAAPEGAHVTVGREGDLVRVRVAAELPGIGRLTVRVGGEAVALAEDTVR